jgi:CRISPR/Cas system-associated exonuclease Cas4 (RecB family)
LEDLQQVPEAEAAMYDGLAPLGLELWLDFILEDESIRVGGFIDRISGDKEAAVIVDYKKSWSKQSRAKFINSSEDGKLLPPLIGYQLPLYIMLTEASGMRVAGSSYYGISEAQHFPVSGIGGVLSEDDVGMLCELTLERIREMAEASRGGNFKAPERCEGCSLRAVCRKRFNVRWKS